MLSYAHKKAGAHESNEHVKVITSLNVNIRK